MSRNQRGGIVFKLLFLVAFLCLLGILYLARHPLLRIAGGFWVVEDPVEHADVIIVIGDDDLSGSRAFHAAGLFRAGWAPQIVASGRRLRPQVGLAELIARDLESFGVPSTAVVRFDHDAANTREEALALRRLVAEKQWRSVLLVTSSYHTRRARYIFRKLLPPEVSLAVIPAHDPAFDPNHWWQNRSGLKIFLLESVSFCVARWELWGSQP